MAKTTKVDIFSGFLGAGKTTLIKKLVKEAYKGEMLVIIENEFGQIGIDGGFLKEAGIEITEMNSGCICCSLVGDFGKALAQVKAQYDPDCIFIEPSGVGKLSDVRRAVENVAETCDIQVNSLVTVADAKKIRMYMKNFGEFYNNQVESAGTIVLSRTQELSEEKLDQAVEMIRSKNDKATIVTTPWDQLTGAQILETMEGSVSLADELMAEVEEEHHHHHEHGEHCTCGCHDHDHEHEHHHDHDEEHEHHHDHDEEHEHHHDHDHHHHHHHHDHDADEVFTSWGRETHRKYTKDEVAGILEALDDQETYGLVLRAKGMLPAQDGTWIYFDMVPGERELREGAPEVTGRFCVIGSKLAEDRLAQLFQVNA